MLQSLINILFPPVCLSCNKRIKHKTDSLCNDCNEKLKDFLDNSICDICGAPKNGNVCHVCKTSLFSFDNARSVFMINNVIRNLIHNYKYRDLPKIGKLLSAYAIEYIKKNKIFSDIDIILPVPLHRVKKRIRGFNQSEIVAKEISRYFGWELATDLIIRKKFTETQTKLSKKQREKNVGNAFKFNPKYKIENKNIMIFDDVFTTGSTVNSISNVLKRHNAKKIYVFTIARAG